MTTQTQHTPGPWAVVEAVGDFFIMPEGESPCIASAPLKGGRNISESRANASLIAAAPELYEALRDLLIAISHDGTVSAQVTARAKARAALSKVQP